MIAKQQFTITYEMTIDTDTGEILNTVILDKSNKKPKEAKVQKNDVHVQLLPNKLQLNSEALEILGASAGDKVDVNYMPLNGKTVPVIKLDVRGNKISNNGAISFRGVKNEELSKYGTEFTVQKHGEIFLLLSGTEGINESVIENNQEVILEDENIEQQPFDLDIEGLEDEVEITNSMFQL